jgi:hypothetical protein
MLCAQQYDGVKIEKIKVDKNNEIYTHGKEFIYRVEIKKDSSQLFIQKCNAEEFQLTANKDSSTISEVHLNIMKPRLFKRTNKQQTEVYYSYEAQPKFTASTGAVENKKNIWIHPPRNGIFRSLETCPFPYIKLDQAIGASWTDSMSIGNHWSDPLWGTWDGRLLMNYDYKIVGKEMLHTSMGEIDCTVIEAIGVSNLGQSHLQAYFSQKFGFVTLNYTLFNGLEINLNLDSVIEGPTLRDVQEFFESRYLEN